MTVYICKANIEKHSKSFRPTEAVTTFMHVERLQSRAGIKRGLKKILFDSLEDQVAPLLEESIGHHWKAGKQSDLKLRFFITAVTINKSGFLTQLFWFFILFLFFNHKTILPLCSAASSRFLMKAMWVQITQEHCLQLHSAALFSKQQYWWLSPEVLLAAPPAMGLEETPQIKICCLLQCEKRAQISFLPL